MKKLYAIIASSRKNWNTAQLLDQALEGAKAAFQNEEVYTERINLYDLNFTGCKSCFACKVNGGKSYAKCALKDDLQEVLDKILNSDGVIIGSPIYFRNITGELHSFYERLLFPYTVYSQNRRGVEEKRIPFDFIYTMNVEEQTYLNDHYYGYFGIWEKFINEYFGYTENMCAYNTVQFNNYETYIADWFSESEKKTYKELHWEENSQRAFQLGQQIINALK